MRRLSAVLLAGAITILPALSPSLGRVHAQAAAPAAPQKLTFDGDIALWSIAVKADKTADFEMVMTKLKEALAKSEKPEAKQQAAGWKVMKGVKLPNGDVIYTQVINPVVKGADYTVMQNIYDSFPDPAERTKYYDMYRASFSQNLGVNTGTIVLDLGK
jgi:hypothetical protein